MESVLVSGIAYDKDQSQITLVHVQDKPGVPHKFSPRWRKRRFSWT